MLPCEIQWGDIDQPFPAFHPTLQSLNFTAAVNVSVNGEFPSLKTLTIPQSSDIRIKFINTDISESSVLQQCYVNRDTLTGYVSLPECKKPLQQPQHISKAQKIEQDTQGQFIYDYPIVFKSDTPGFLQRYPEWKELSFNNYGHPKYTYTYNQNQDVYQIQFRRGIKQNPQFPTYVHVASNATSLYCECSPVQNLNIFSQGLPLLYYTAGGFKKSLPESMHVHIGLNGNYWFPCYIPKPNPYATQSDSDFNPKAGKLKKLVLKHSKLDHIRVCCAQDFSCSLQDLPRLYDVTLMWAWIRSSQRADKLADQLLKATSDSQQASDAVHLKRYLDVYPVKPSAFASAKQRLQNKGWEVSSNEMFTIQASDSFLYMGQQRAFCDTYYAGQGYCPAQAYVLLPPSYGPKGASIYSPGKQGIYAGQGQVVYKGTTEYYPTKFTELHIGAYQENYQSNRMPLTSLDVSNTSIQRLLVYPLYVFRGTNDNKYISLTSLNVSNCSKLRDFVVNVQAPNWTSNQIQSTVNQLYANNVTNGRLILGKALYDKITFNIMKKLLLIGKAEQDDLNNSSDSHLNWDIDFYFPSNLFNYKSCWDWEIDTRHTLGELSHIDTDQSSSSTSLPLTASYDTYFTQTIDYGDGTYTTSNQSHMRIYDLYNPQGSCSVPTGAYAEQVWLDKLRPVKFVSWNVYDGYQGQKMQYTYIPETDRYTSNWGGTQSAQDVVEAQGQHLMFGLSTGAYNQTRPFRWHQKMPQPPYFNSLCIGFGWTSGYHQRGINYIRDQHTGQYLFNMGDWSWSQHKQGADYESTTTFSMKGVLKIKQRWLI